MNLLKAFLTEIADVLHAERQLLKALPKLQEAAQSPELKEALSQHLSETDSHVKTLEQILKIFEKPVRAKRCIGMEGIIADGMELVKAAAADAPKVKTAAGKSETTGKSEPATTASGETGSKTDTKDSPNQETDACGLDAVIIAAAQKAEHYEIATYGTLIAWSHTLGKPEATSLLEGTLQQERSADETLTQIAQRSVNPQATPFQPNTSQTGESGTKQHNKQQTQSHVYDSQEREERRGEYGTSRRRGEVERPHSTGGRYRDDQSRYLTEDNRGGGRSQGSESWGSGRSGGQDRDWDDQQRNQREDDRGSYGRYQGQGRGQGGGGYGGEYGGGSSGSSHRGESSHRRPEYSEEGRGQGGQYRDRSEAGHYSGQSNYGYRSGSSNEPSGGLSRRPDRDRGDEQDRYSSQQDRRNYRSYGEHSSGSRSPGQSEGRRSAGRSSRDQEDQGRSSHDDSRSGQRSHSGGYRESSQDRGFSHSSREYDDQNRPSSPSGDRRRTDDYR